MATLKGKNFRILVYHTSSSKYKVVGMSTNCSITYTNNTENGNHKDVIGIAQNPIVVSQGCTISVESLDVSDAAAMLTAIKSLTPFTLMWDETSLTNNQTPQGASFARSGQFFLNDATFQFDNRTNATKSLQFTSTGAVSTLDTTPDISEVSSFSYTRGQNVRLFLSNSTAAASKVIAAARTLQVHVSLTLEDATTKDTDGNWTVQEATELSWDITTSALIRGNDTITSSVQAQGLSELETIKEAGEPVSCKIANVSGDNNRTAGTAILSGSVIISQLTINGPLGTAEYTAQLQGFGPYASVG